MRPEIPGVYKLLIFRDKLLRAYYAATVLFLLLGCLGLIAWRPGLTTLVTTMESLLILGALIISTGARVMTLSESALTSTPDFVTTEELVNFAIVGFAAWYGWFRGTEALKKQLWD